MTDIPTSLLLLLNCMILLTRLGPFRSGITRLWLAGASSSLWFLSTRGMLQSANPHSHNRNQGLCQNMPGISACAAAAFSCCPGTLGEKRGLLSKLPAKSKGSALTASAPGTPWTPWTPWASLTPSASPTPAAPLGLSRPLQAVTEVAPPASSYNLYLSPGAIEFGGQVLTG